MDNSVQDDTIVKNYAALHEALTEGAMTEAERRQQQQQRHDSWRQQEPWLQGRGSTQSLNETLTSMNPQYYDDQLGSASHSLSSIDRIPGEDVVSGARTNGRMSVVRRFFCLFVLFDLLLTSLTWLICIMLIGSNDIIATLRTQIVYYKIGTSLFDIVMAAVCRFTVLLLFYGVLYLYTRFFVALTTLGTCIFLIFKVFYYDWASANQPAFQVCLILISFVLAWTEAWFLDFRVIPQEVHAQQYLQNSVRQSDPLSALLLDPQMRNPVLRNFLQRLPRMEDSTESVGNFYSPLESPNQSDDETDEHKKQDFTDAELQLKGRETLEVAWKLLNSSGWRLEKETDNGDSIYFKQIPQVGKVFKLRAKINVTPKKLLEELFYSVDNMSRWNRTITESKRLKILDEQTDITYQVSAPAAGGMIASRDFVNLRYWCMKEDCYVVAAVSIPHHSMPSNKKHIRGENGPCCWAMRPSIHDVNSCFFEFLLNTNLKGWIPQYLLDNALTTVLLEHSQLLKAHSEMLTTLT